eukprot:TRINITY_DN7275_c0_g1_i4.p1 TRINITY_DN7275_c0_g1~~TRINITY_DN7275_c0_g1_i4.p1  ORF type:complete len:191 (+),score=20.76 TRINITY_DN7275_c0_g1_i4:228-800(+)
MSAMQVEQLKHAIDNGSHVSGLVRDEQPATVALLLRRFLEDLPAPLIPCSLFDAMVDTSQLHADEPRVTSFASLIRSAPAANREVLQQLLPFLGRLVQSAHKNGCTQEKLAAWCAPVITRPDLKLRDPCHSGHRQHYQASLRVVEQLLKCQADLLDVLETPSNKMWDSDVHCSQTEHDLAHLSELLDLYS